MNDEYFMEIALQEAASALNNEEFPVGCVIVYENDVMAKGSRIGSKGETPNEIDHAEMVALRHMYNQQIKIHKKKATIYCTLEPCLMCFGAIVLSGIGRIVYAYEDVMGGGTKSQLCDLAPLYQNCKIDIVADILRDNSINLLKKFFKNPKNSYWQGSLLAKYTLDQPSK